MSRGRGLSPSSSSSQIRHFIENDEYLFAVYGEQYRALRELLPKVSGPVVELGAGTAIGHNWIPDMECTDVQETEYVQSVVDATQLPYPDGEIRALILKDSLHHFSDVPEFLDEAARCLKVGGAVVCCEPYWGPMAKLVFTHLHPEPFDTATESWTSSSDDPWDSNQAMAWLLLRRDRAALEARWPMFRVEEFGPIVGPSYLLSGGVFGRTPLPSRLLVKLHQWEMRRGRSLDLLRFEVLFRLTKRW